MDPRARAVYRIDVRSFFDTDADGLGDINGIAAKIDYIKELGADTLMLSPVFSGEGFMIDPEIGTADDLDALIDKAASRMIGTVLEMRADMPLNDASDIDRASAAMRYWLDRGAMGIAINTDALTASGDKRALHRAMCALNRNVFSLYPDCFTVGIGKNVPFEDTVQLTRTENRELLMQLYIPAHMAEAFSPASGSLGALFGGGDAKRFKHDADYYQVQGELKGGWFLNGIALAQGQFSPQKELTRRLRSKAACLYVMTGRGTPLIRQGDEIGLYAENTPMQWNNSRAAGFTLGTPRLKGENSLSHINVEDDMTHMDSVCSFYKRAIALRRSHSALIGGEYAPVDSENPRVMAYTRSDGAESLLVVINITDRAAKVALAGCEKGECLLFTNSPKPIAESMKLQPYEGFVYRLR